MSLCIHCRQAEIREWPGFGQFRRITSDCRSWSAGGHLGVCPHCATVQKPTTPAWLEECRRIYGDYHAYYQGKGAEQAVFLSGGLGQVRSKAFLTWIFSAIPPTEAGQLLDVGCGNGNLLASMAELFPRWRLAGADLGEAHRTTIEAIPQVEWFHSQGLENLPGSFDLITAVHLLEHLDRPWAGLRTLAASLKPGGRLAIEVPDLRSNPFDLLIADHASHFTASTLSRTLQACGLQGRVFEDVIPRELSVIVQSTRVQDDRSAVGPAAGDEVDGARAMVDRHLAWLRALLAAARDAAGQSSKVALMGSSIAAGWLAAELAGCIDCFIDEDPNRAGSTFLDLPILAPEQLPRSTLLLLPMTPATAEPVAARMTALGLRVVLPPTW